MKVKEIKTTPENVTLEAVASVDEVERAILSAKFAFARSMGVQLPSDDVDIDALVREQLGVKDLDPIVKDAAIETLVPIAIDKRNLAPLYPPKAQPSGPFERGAEFPFKLEVTIKPRYELTSYDPIEITLPPFSLDESIVDAQLDEIAKRYTAYIKDESAPADRRVEKGDIIKIALKATENGRELKGLTTEGRTYTVGEGYMPEGFENEILGMKAGETKSFTFESPGFDEDLHECTQTIDATATVVEFQKESTPEIDDAWVEMNMPMYPSARALRDEVKKGLESQARLQYDALVRQEAAAAIAKRFKGTIADEVYEAMRGQYLTNLRLDLQQQGITLDDFIEQNGGEQQFGMLLMLQVRQMLVQGFALDAVFQHEGLSLTDEDIEEACFAMNPQVDPKETRRALEESGRGFALRESAERLKANKHIVDHGMITYATGGETV